MRLHLLIGSMCNISGLMTGSVAFNLKTSFSSSYQSTLDVQILLSKWHFYGQNMSCRHLPYLKNNCISNGFSLILKTSFHTLTHQLLTFEYNCQSDICTGNICPGDICPWAICSTFITTEISDKFSLVLKILY